MSRPLALGATAALPVLVLAVFFVLPLVGMVRRGFIVDGSWEAGTVLHVLGRREIHKAIWFTVWASTTATVLSVLLSLPAAYALHRVALPFRRLVRAALLVPFVLPTVVVGVAFRQLLDEGGPLAGLGLDGTPVAIIAGLVFFNVAVVIRSVGAAWEGLDARPAEAAAALGARPWTVFRTVTLPALRPSIVGSASVVFLFCATAFGVILTLGGLRYNNLETEIYKLTTEFLDLPGAAAISILQLVVVVLLLTVAGRLRQVADPTQTRALHRPHRVAFRDAPQLAATAVLLAFVGAPILTLVAGSFRVGGRWSLGNYRALQTPGSGNALPVTATAALATSLEIALVATAIALVLGAMVATVVTRRSRGRVERGVRSLLDGFFMLPLGVSAVTLGFGLFITLDRPPVDFRDSPWLVPLAQALVALPLVVRTLVPVLGSIDDRQRQAAASLGAGPLRQAATVDLPAVWKPLMAAAGFAFAVSLGEFGATSFLVRSDHPTLPVVIYRLINHPGAMNYGMALAASCVLAAATALVMLVVERLRVPSLGVM